MKPEKLLGLVFSAIGICLLIGDIFAYRYTAGFLETAGRAEGIVVDLVSSSLGRGGGSRTYAPVVRFSAPGGDFEFTSSFATYPPSYSKGDSVEVLYDSSNPASAEINGFFSLWFLVFILSLLGGVFSAIGVALLRFAR